MTSRQPSRPALAALALPLCALAGCDSDGPALVQFLSPLAGLTAQATTTRPLLRVREGLTFEVGNRRVVLYDVTGGNKVTVAGGIEVEGVLLSYLPSTSLGADRDFLLEVQQSAVKGDDFELQDASEQPPEPLTWPLRFPFSTRTAPRVRAAYLESQEGGGQRLTVHFSQSMAPLPTGSAVQVLDGISRKPIPLSAPLWTDDRTLKVSPGQKLIGTQLYTLKVAATAEGANGTALDGDRDGLAGEKVDDFCMGLTGIQEVIFSRLGSQKPSPCP